MSRDAFPTLGGPSSDARNPGSLARANYDHTDPSVAYSSGAQSLVAGPAFLASAQASKTTSVPALC